MCRYAITKKGDQTEEHGERYKDGQTQRQRYADEQRARQLTAVD